MPMGKLRKFVPRKKKISKNMRKQVNEIVLSRIMRTAETKVRDIGSNANPLTPTNNGFLQSIFNGITVGTGDLNERIGDEIAVHSIDLKALFHNPTAGYEAIRIIVFKWKIEAAPNVADILQYNNMALSPTTLDSKKATQYTILSDRLVRNNATGKEPAYWRYKHKFKIPLKVAYSAGGSLVLRNDIYILMLPTYSSGVAPTFDNMYRARYKDF